MLEMDCARYSKRRSGIGVCRLWKSVLGVFNTYHLQAFNADDNQVSKWDRKDMNCQNEPVK